ncbi:sensor histidine kinase [Bacillus marasmi]|uniref:sensor histidine kinase n=1 Tax=Bacillus marasmi TaxID=1926279 RepID=UPI0011CB4120|nr:ATP-binding protein [Bacillus marasmi]
MKLKNRINLYTTVLFIILLIFINGSIYFSFSKMMLQKELERTMDEAARAVKGINQTETPVPPKELLQAYVPINGMLQMVKSDGKRGAGVVVPEQQSLRDTPVKFYQKEVNEIVEMNGIPHAFVSMPIVWNDGEVVAMQLTESLKTTADMLAMLKIILIAVTVIATVPVIISSRLLGNFITRPITSMIITMSEIIESSRFKRISLPKESKDELYQMGRTFNRMIELLEMNYEKQGRFISNASHELKTPLTVIESYASLLKRRGKEQPELFEESVQAIHSEAIRMKDLTEQLLLMARHDEQWKIELEDIRLTPIITELVRSFQKAYQREIKLRIEAEDYVRADQQKLKQLLYILLDNARKYSEDFIEVVILKNKEKVAVEICDRGIGIPPAELEKIFDRFYRVDKARTRQTGGFGLGLALAKEISEATCAELQIESTEGVGTKAKILLLPANPQ